MVCLKGTNVRCAELFSSKGDMVVWYKEILIPQWLPIQLTFHLQLTRVPLENLVL